MQVQQRTYPLIFDISCIRRFLAVLARCHKHPVCGLILHLEACARTVEPVDRIIQFQKGDS